MQIIYNTLRQYQNRNDPRLLRTTCEEYGFNAAALSKRPTIIQDQADDLKYDESGVRVWLSRCTVEDGEPYDNKVTIALEDNGHWDILAEYPG